MKRKANNLSRREALKVAGLGIAGLSMPAFHDPMLPARTDPVSRLGRICAASVDVFSQPDATSSSVATLYEDSLIECHRELVGYHPYRINQRWIETPDGYIWSPNVQPVENHPNPEPLTLVETSQGPGLWAEVSVPYVDLVLDNPPARSPWLQDALYPRLYYSQVVWIDQLREEDDVQLWCRINERFGYGDILWAKAEGFRPITENELAPIAPDVEDKQVVVNLSRQSLSCFENGREVFYTRISSGARFDAQGNPVDQWSTPVGAHPIWRKIISLHMSGGTTGGGYDLPGIGWTSLFVGNGVAIHSTFWHNNYGVPMSHGCINARPQDAKWIFRWTAPHVPFDPGDVTIGMPGGTKISVIEE